MRNPPPNHEATAPVPLVLYRATVTRFEDETVARPMPEVTVFFEAQRANHTAVMEALLHHAWQVDVSLLVITCSSERELIDHFAMGPATDDDVRLFENGYDTQSIFYVDPALTQFFVRPETQIRLLAAQAIANRRRLEGQARRAFDVARRASDRTWVQGESTRATS